MPVFQSPGVFQSDDEGYAPPNFGGTVAVKAGVITFEDTTATELFTIPAGAYLVDFYVEVTTVFNDSGTDLLIVGTSANDDAYVDDLDVSSAGVSRYGDTSTVLLTTFTQLDEDTVIYGKYTGQNANASAGRAAIVFTYILA